MLKYVSIDFALIYSLQDMLVIYFTVIVKLYFSGKSLSTDFA
jgi:hypothetical protein